MPLPERCLSCFGVQFYSGGMRSFQSIFVEKGTRREHVGFISMFEDRCRGTDGTMKGPPTKLQAVMWG